MNKVFIMAYTMLGVITACAQTPCIVAEGESPVRVADSYSFTEGPAVDARGDVYFTDQHNSNLIACADMDNQLRSFDIGGHSKILITDYRGKLMNGPNDVWISGKYVKDHFGMTPLEFRNN